MIVSMTTTARPQRRYDHRLQHLVRRTGDVTVATDVSLWLVKSPFLLRGVDVAADRRYASGR
jgi:hypothetical protein